MKNIMEDKKKKSGVWISVYWVLCVKVLRGSLVSGPSENTGESLFSELYQENYVNKWDCQL